MTPLSIGETLLGLLAFAALVIAVFVWRWLQDRGSAALNRTLFKGDYTRGKNETSLMVIGTTDVGLDSLKSAVNQRLRSVEGLFFNERPDGSLSITSPGIFGATSFSAVCFFTALSDGHSKASYKVTHWTEVDGIASGSKDMAELKQAFITGIKDVGGTVEEVS